MTCKRDADTYERDADAYERHKKDGHDNEDDARLTTIRDGIIRNTETPHTSTLPSLPQCAVVESATASIQKMLVDVPMVVDALLGQSDESNLALLPQDASGHGELQFYYYWVVI